MDALGDIALQLLRAAAVSLLETIVASQARLALKAAGRRLFSAKQRRKPGRRA